MREIVITVIEKGLRGHFTHTDSFKILDNLTHEQATEVVSEGLFSSWEILYHIIYWHRLILEGVRTDEMDWKQAMDKHWPTRDEENENKWDTLVERFKGCIHDAIELLHEVDLTAPMKSLGNEPTLKAFTILAQHNSYHLGQIVMNRKASGTWSLQEE
ncbi:MAG: DinB family protein [Candidatus Thorarchaeota archaeon]